MNTNYKREEEVLRPVVVQQTTSSFSNFGGKTSRVVPEPEITAVLPERHKISGTTVAITSPVSLITVPKESNFSLQVESSASASNITNLNSNLKSNLNSSPGSGHNKLPLVDNLFSAVDNKPSAGINRVDKNPSRDASKSGIEQLLSKQNDINGASKQNFLPSSGSTEGKLKEQSTTPITSNDQPKETGRPNTNLDVPIDKMSEAPPSESMAQSEASTVNTRKKNILAKSQQLTVSQPRLHGQGAFSNPTATSPTPSLGQQSNSTNITGVSGQTGNSKSTAGASRGKKVSVTSGMSIFQSKKIRAAAALFEGVVGVNLGAANQTDESYSPPALSASKKKTAQSLVFQELDEYGNPIGKSDSLVESESQLTLHLRYVGFSFICAFPLFFAISSACWFVIPGYTPCNLGEENCNLEYGLNTFVYTALVCPFVYVACPCLWDHEKFMEWFPLKYFLIRLTIPWTIFQLLIQYITKNDWQYASFYLICLRLVSSLFFFPYLEAMRFYLGYDEDWWDIRKCLSFPNHPTWRERLPPFYGLVFLVIPAVFWCSYAATDAAFIATGEWGTTLQDWRTPIFFFCKRITYLMVCVSVSFFKEPPLVAGRIRQLIPWTLHVCLGLATPIVAMNAKDWWALAEFIGFDCIALSLRVFAFSDFADENFIVKGVKKVLRFQKMPVISGMNIQELRGWELICESVAMQIIYLSLFMFYVFAHLFLNTGSGGPLGDSDCPARDYHVVYRFWFPHSHSLPGLVILLIVDLIQDVTVRHYVVSKTGCSFSLMMGQPVLSYMTNVSMLCVGVAGFIANLISQVAYFFEKEQLGVFKTADPLDCAY